MATNAALQKKLVSALERASTAEQETLEQARLNGMGSEREALQLGKIAALERALLKANGEGGLIDQLQKLIGDAYRDGFNECLKEKELASQGGCRWLQSETYIKLNEILDLRNKLLSKI